MSTIIKKFRKVRNREEIERENRELRLRLSQLIDIETKIHDAARDFVLSVDKVHQDPDYIDVQAVAEGVRGLYEGASYAVQLDKLRTILGIEVPSIVASDVAGRPDQLALAD